MSFGGPPLSTLVPSGPFEEQLTAIASSPYSIGMAIFLLNTCGRFLPFEVSKEQEKFLNQPTIRRIIIFVIFFVATRNIVVAGMMSLVMIICIGYLFNENSSLCLFGKGTPTIPQVNAQPTVPSPSLALGLSMEEQQILKSLTDKAERLKGNQTVNTEKPIEDSKRINLNEKYKNVLQNLWTT